jgi:hypothetical protein
MRYVFHSRVSLLEEKKRAVRAYKTGRKLDDGKDEIEVEYEKLGWFVGIDEFAISISVGDARPPWEPGQKITMTIEEASE